jgi:hypothetical protein
MRWPLIVIAALVMPAHAERGAFCELTPCLPGPVLRRVLTKDEVHNKVTCKKGAELGVDKQGRLVFCTTAKPADLDGIAVARDAYTLFHPNGRIYQTHVRAKFEALLADKSKVSCGAELISLFDDGTLGYCELAGPRAGSPRARVAKGIAFHRSGKVAGMTLDETFRAGILVLAPGTSVQWDEKGTVIAGRTSVPLKAGALSIQGAFTLHPNGKLHEVALADKATIQSHHFPDRARLWFRADGTLERAEYLERRGTMPHGEAWTDTRHLTFDGGGKITNSYLDHWQSTVRPPSATRRRSPQNRRRDLDGARMDKPS